MSHAVLCLPQVESVPRQVLQDFWKRWYFPGNATLYLVGDFEGSFGGGMDAAERLIRETFGRVPAGRQPGNGVPGPLKQRQLVSSPAFHTSPLGRSKSNVVFSQLGTLS